MLYRRFLLFYIGKVVLNLDTGVLQSLIFLKLVVAGHLTMFVTRNSGHFWSVKPSGIFFWSVILTDIFATLLVVFGSIFNTYWMGISSFSLGLFTYSLCNRRSDENIFLQRILENGYFKRFIVKEGTE